MAIPCRFRRYSLAILFAVVLAPASRALAATYTVAPFTITIPDSIPASEKIRGAIAVQQWSPMVTEANGKAQFDAFVVEQRLVTISAGFQDQTNLTRAQIDAEYRSLVSAFDTLAVRANRPELHYVGFIFQGCSVHGAQSLTEGFGNPDRTIAVISFCGRDYALFTLLPQFTPFMPELSFPHLQVSNGNDLDRVPWNDSTVRQVRREARGLWTSSLHPRLGHCEPAADGIAFELLWLREAIKARVPAVIPDGPYTLAKLTDTDGWLGDYAPVRSTDGASVWGTGYEFTEARVVAASSVPAADVGDYQWFPSRIAAEEWKHYSDTGTCCLGLTEPPPPACGDGTCTAGVEDCSSCPSDCGACAVAPGGSDPAPGGGGDTTAPGTGGGSSGGGGTATPGTGGGDTTAPGTIGGSIDGGTVGAEGSTTSGTTAVAHGCEAAGTSLLSALAALGLLARRKRRS